VDPDPAPLLRRPTLSFAVAAEEEAGEGARASDGRAGDGDDDARGAGDDRDGDAAEEGGDGRA